MSAHNIFGWIATAFSSVVFTVPINKYINLFKGQLNYEDLPIYSLGAAYSNCFLWYLYGKLMFSHQLRVCNIIGCGFSLFFITVYLAYEIKKFIIDTVLNALIIFTGTWTAYRTFTSIVTDRPTVGKICIITTLFVLFSPLNLIYRVISEKNYKLISLPIAIFTIFSGVFWVIYGFLRHNFYIICANLIISLVGVLQIIVSEIYKKKISYNRAN